MRRARLIALGGVVLVVLAVLVTVLVVRDMLSPRHFTALLAEQAAKVGLELHLQGPARPAIWPHLAVRLYGLQLNRRGYDESMLRARQVLLVVTWSSLLRGEPHIQKLRVLAPRIDLEQVQAWLADLDHEATSKAPSLPTIGTGIHVADGVVVKHNTLLLKGLQLNTGTLKPGKPFTLHAQALSAEGQSLEVRLQTRPIPGARAVTFDPLNLYLAAGAPPALRLHGTLRWRGGLRLQGGLSGTLELADGSFDASIGWPQGEQADDTMRLQLSGDARQLDLVLEPAQAVAWWQRISAGTGLSLPPIEGTVSADSLDLGSLHIQGLSITSRVPASAASRAAPAEAGSVAPAATISAATAATAATPAEATTSGAP